MEIEIAGGGIIGLSIAWRLAQRGLKVTVRDAGRLAGESSWAGAGMLAPGGEFRTDSKWTRLAIESLAEFGSFVRELEAATGIPVDYRVCGAVEVAFNDAEAAAVRESAKRLAGLGIRNREIDSREAWERVPGLSREVHAAWWFPDEAVADPRDICRALIEACRSLGAELRENDPVESCRPPMVVAAGAWSSRIGGLEGAPRSFPVKGHLLGFNRLPGSLSSIVRQGHHYALQRASGFTIFGSDTYPESWVRSSQPEAIAALQAEAARLLPNLLQGEPTTVWTGFRPGSDSQEPVVEKLPGADVWLAYGHYRNGILLAPVTARLIADAICPNSERD